MIPKYYQLLSEALKASESVDNFDLRSEDPVSAANFKGLLDGSNMAQKKLCYHIRKHQGLFALDDGKTCSIYLVKATRKPTFVKHVSKEEAMQEMDKLAGPISILQGASLASTGISIQLVNRKYDEEISKIEIGGIRFVGIPVLFQYFGY